MNHSPTSLLKKKKKKLQEVVENTFQLVQREAEATLLWPLLLSGGGGWRGRDTLGDWVSGAT